MPSADTSSNAVRLDQSLWLLIILNAYLGYLLAVGVDGALWGDSRWPAHRAIGIWVLLLGGGTAIAIKAVDPSDRRLLPKPLRRPKLSLEMAAGLLAGGFILSFTLPYAFRAVYVLASVLSLLLVLMYANKLRRLLWAASALFLGALTPLAGYEAVGVQLRPNAVLAMIGLTALLAAIYPLYWHVKPGAHHPILGGGGVRAVVLSAVSFSFLVMITAWTIKADALYGGGTSYVGIAALLASFAVWIVQFVRWSGRRTVEIDDKTEKKFQTDMLQALVVTDVALVVALSL